MLIFLLVSWTNDQLGIWTEGEQRTCTPEFWVREEKKWKGGICNSVIKYNNLFTIATPMLSSKCSTFISQCSVVCCALFSLHSVMHCFQLETLLFYSWYVCILLIYIFLLSIFLLFIYIPNLLLNYFVECHFY